MDYASTKPPRTASLGPAPGLTPRGWATLTKSAVILWVAAIAEIDYKKLWWGQAAFPEHSHIDHPGKIILESMHFV